MIQIKDNYGNDMTLKEVGVMLKGNPTSKFMDEIEQTYKENKIMGNKNNDSSKSLDEIGNILGHHAIPLENINDVSNYLKQSIEKHDEDLKKSFMLDKLDSNTKFGVFEVELENGSYKVSTQFYADDFEDSDLPKGENKKELLFYSKQLNILEKLFYQNYNLEELSAIVKQRTNELEQLENKYKRMKNDK